MSKLVQHLAEHLTNIISETNGISIAETLELAINAEFCKRNAQVKKSLAEFKKLLGNYQQGEVDINTLLLHPVSDALRVFFKNFPLPYHEEHIHLTGSLTAEFVHPRLKRLLKEENREVILKKIHDTFGKD